MKYEKTQYGWIGIILLLMIIVSMNIAYVKQLGTHPIPKVPFLIMTGIFFVILGLFYKLTIIVADRTIKIVYGIGIIRKVISPDRILSTQVKKLPWYYGSGIRITPHGWLYSISGFKVVQIEFETKGIDKAILIGTSEPEELKRIIDNNFS